ncbi:MAG: efflux RND transporter permease subunit [Victivallales bacterium]|nr:efflux RND transporter permease subunit [Victivallales bacterium]
MSFASFSARRPVFISMAACIVLIIGLVSLFNLPVDLMPDITYPTVTISTSYDNASPEEMEELITRPIEKAVSAVSGVSSIISYSEEGYSTVRVYFEWGSNLDVAIADIRDRVERIKAWLPEDADSPYIRKFDVSNYPIMTIGISTAVNLLDARKIVDDQVLYRIERTAGVATCNVWGGLTREIQVLFDPDKIKMLDIPFNRILNAIKAGNVTAPAGNLEMGRLDVRIRTPGTLTSLDELRDTVIGYHDGAMIRLRDVATVLDTVVKPTRLTRINGHQGLYMQVMKQSGANTVEVAAAVREELKKIEQELPQLHFIITMDTSKYIERSINNVMSSACTGGILAIMVLLFFLRNVLSTLIISVSIPLSIVASFILNYFCGYTLNIMTLGGLALGIGLLVDNSIVVLENINRHHDEGMNANDAVIKGGVEVTGAIISSTLTTLVVFLPLMFIKGISGIMFREFSAVVAFSLTCSIFTAILLVPMLSAQLLRFNRKPRHGWRQRLFVWSGTQFAALETAYAMLLRRTLQHPWRLIGGVVLLFAATLGLLPLLGAEFMPKTDENEVRIRIKAEMGTRYEMVDKAVRQIEDDLPQAVPEMRYRTSRSNNDSGRIEIALKPRSQRRRSSEEIADFLEKRYARIPGVEVQSWAGGGLWLLRMGSTDGARANMEIRGHDMISAMLLGQKYKAIIEKIPGVTSAWLSRDKGIPEKRVIIDRSKAADLRVSVNTITDALRTILTGSSAGEFREGGKEYNIRVKVRDADKMNLEQLLDVSISNEDGQKVILRNLLRSEDGTGPTSIERKDQERYLSIGFNIIHRDMNSVIADIRSAIRNIPLPPNFSISFTGDYEEQQKSFHQLMYSLILALILVYMVMACQFESLLDPLIVMFATPLAAIGVIIMLFLTDTTLNLQSFIGCIMLAGIVVNNAILLVDCARRLRGEGYDIRHAVEEAGRQRLRPILMTTLTTLLGLLPLALGWGDGAEAQAPLARAVIGGLTSSTIITLLFIPCLFLLVESLATRWKSRSIPGAGNAKD